MALHLIKNQHVERLHAPGMADDGDARIFSGPLCEPRRRYVSIPKDADTESWPYYYECFPMYWDDNEDVADALVNDPP